MQVRRQYLPIAAKYDQLFSKTQKVNRVELVSDFPKGNDAEVVSSLQIHPQGWCSLSRNISYDESSEWTCVHDIQEMQEEDVDEESSEYFDLNINEFFPASAVLQNQNNSTISTNSLSNSSSGSSTSSSNDNEEQNQQAPAANIQIEIEPPENENPVNENEQRGRINNVRPSLINTDEILDLWAGNTPFIQRTRRTPTDRPYRLNTGILTVPTRLTLKPNIKQNRKRMLYYIEEPNQGKGFIKELCFSADGRLICSPYGYGIRLLAFSKTCQELPDVLAPDHQPQKLHQLMSSEKHKDIVVSTKFSPRAPIIVSGCLQGGIIWNQPN
jgi:WD repeat-containing protein 32